MTVAMAGQATRNLRYLKLGQDGSIAQAWVHCNVGSADVVGLADGTAVVSYSVAGTDGHVFLASPN